MLTVHIHQVRGSRLGEVEIQPATEAPRKPPVPSGAAIAARRIRRPVLLLALPAIRPALRSVRVRAETDGPVPSAMRGGYRTVTGGGMGLLAGASITWAQQNSCAAKPP